MSLPEITPERLPDHELAAIQAGWAMVEEHAQAAARWPHHTDKPRRMVWRTPDHGRLTRLLAHIAWLTAERDRLEDAIKAQRDRRWRLSEPAVARLRGLLPSRGDSVRGEVLVPDLHLAVLLDWYEAATADGEPPTANHGRTPMPDRLTRLLCRLLGHAWRLGGLRLDGSRQRVCRRCGRWL